MSKYWYMAVSADEFERPIYIEDNPCALAEKLGIKTKTVYNSINQNYSGKITGRKIVKIKK